MPVDFLLPLLVGLMSPAPRVAQLAAFRTDRPTAVPSPALMSEAGDKESLAKSDTRTFSEDDVMQAFSKRLADEGGARQVALRSSLRKAERNVADAGQTLKDTVDWDGQRAARSVSQREGDLVNWRTTVGGFGLVALLAVLTGLVTSVPPDSGAPPATPTYDPPVWDLIKR